MSQSRLSLLKFLGITLKLGTIIVSNTIANKIQVFIILSENDKKNPCKTQSRTL
jgi:hypothetical protein